MDSKYGGMRSTSSLYVTVKLKIAPALTFQLCLTCETHQLPNLCQITFTNSLFTNSFYSFKCSFIMGTWHVYLHQKSPSCIFCHEERQDPATERMNGKPPPRPRSLSQIITRCLLNVVSKVPRHSKPD